MPPRQREGNNQESTHEQFLLLLCTITKLSEEASKALLLVKQAELHARLCIDR